MTLESIHETPPSGGRHQPVTDQMTDPQSTFRKLTEGDNQGKK